MRSEGDVANGSSSSPDRPANGTTTASHKNGSASILNGSSHPTASSNGATSSHSNGTAIPQDSSTLPSFYGHDREEVTRLLIQGLHDLGYGSAASALSRESGYDLETPYASAFRMAILQGEWEEAEALLCDTYVPDDGGVGINPDANGGLRNDEPSTRDSGVGSFTSNRLILSPGADKGEMLFLIRQQKYLELLERGDLGAGLMVLRQELQPLHQDERQLHALSGLMMCQSPDDLKYQASWDGALGDSRRLLLSILSRSISPSVMIPEHRLAELLTKIKDDQIVNCQYHNTAKWPSLYTGHQCDRDSLPTDPIRELNHHQDEVWFLQFSNDGSKLATASKDTNVVIYDTMMFEVLHILSQHETPVTYFAWSPDDKQLVTCSQNVARLHEGPNPGSPSQAKLWDTQSGVCLRTITYIEIQPVTTAAWSPDGMTYVVGSCDPDRPLTIWSKASHSDVPLHNFAKVCPRVVDCAIASVTPISSLKAQEDSSREKSSSIRPIRLVAVCGDYSIQVFDYVRREKLRHIVLDHEITCLNLSGDGQEMLISLKGDEVWIMGVEECEMRRKFLGQKQANFVIRSCFGGASEGFVVSGGADSIISIWHRFSGRLLQQLPGHRSGCVNAVAWNPKRADMFASAGDDFSVKIWSKSTDGSGRNKAQPISSSRTELGGNDNQAQELPSWGPGETDAADTATGGSGSRGVVAALMRR